MTERAAYFRNADGIRGLACLVVLLVHSVNGIFTGARPYLPGTGKVGVWLFFVLSAFLLTNHLFLRGVGIRSLIDYVLARIFKIVPLFVLAVLFYFVLGTAGIATTQDLIQAVTLSKGYAHLWTVPVELKFYVLLFPLTVPTIAIYRQAGPVWSAAFVLITGIAWSILFPFTGTAENSPQLRWYVPCFLIGMLCAVVYPSIKDRAVRLPSITISLFVFLAMIAMTDYFRAFYYADAPGYWLGNKFILLGALWAVFMVVNLDDTGPVGGILASSAMTNIGRWSYPIYLFHWYVVTKASELHPGSVLSVAVSILLSIALGAILHLYIERPIMIIRGRVGRTILQRQPDRQPA